MSKRDKYVVKNMEVLLDELDSIEESLEKKVNTNDKKLDCINDLMEDSLANFHNIIRNLQPFEKKTVDNSYNNNGEGSLPIS